MGGLDYNGDAKRLQDGFKASGNFRRHLLLDLKPFGENVDEACQFGNSDNALAGKITNMSLADNGREMMLTMRFKRDIAKNNDFVITCNFLEGPIEIVPGVVCVT